MPGEDEPPEDAWETAGEDLDLDQWSLRKSSSTARTNGSSNSSNISNSSETNQHLQNISDKLESLQKVMEQEGKMRRIEFALQNMHYAVKDWVFAYGTPSVTLNANAEQVVQQILFAFRVGKGYDVGKYFLVDRTNSNGRDEPDHSGGNSGYDKFRIQLCHKLHLLLGQKPRIQMCSNASSSSMGMAAQQPPSSLATVTSSVGQGQGQGQGHVLIFYN